MGADVAAQSLGMSGIPGLSTALDIGGSILNYGIGSKRNKSKRKALEEANRQAGIAINQGYDTALGALGTGEKALNAGYEKGTAERKAAAAGMTDVAQKGFDAQQNMWTPWTVPGLNAYNQIDTLLNDPQGYNTILAKYQQSPQYQFQLQQSLDAVKRSAAATGNRLGGAQLSALSDRAGDVAGQSFNSWLDRLQTMANTGFNAQSNLAQARNNLTTGQTNALQYGDTSAFDIAKGKDILGINQQRGDIGIQRGSDMANLALGRGQISANYHMAQGANAQNLVSALGQQGGGESGASSLAGLGKLAALF